jgi:hypothetical protein
VPIIYANHDYGYGGCSDCGCTGISVHVHDSISGLIQSHPEIKRELIQAGWVPLKKIKELQDKATLQNKFYVADDPGVKAPCHIGLREVKIHHLEEWDISLLTRGTTMLVQRVDPKTVLPDHVYKRMAEAAKWREKEVKDKEVAKQKREERKKQRKLEEAKKLVEAYQNDEGMS